MPADVSRVFPLARILLSDNILHPTVTASTKYVHMGVMLA
jgi:hypothetical protein